MKLLSFEVGPDRPFFLIAGPCVIESEELVIDVAGRLKEMTAALYDRIGAIERFAADVAHELKNPLTSLASAMVPAR